jgi:nucleoid DNA-binding protein
VRDGRVALAGLGVFKKVLRAPMKVANPVTGKIIDVPARHTVRFRPSAALKEAVA